MEAGDVAELIRANELGVAVVHFDEAQDAGSLDFGDTTIEVPAGSNGDIIVARLDSQGLSTIIACRWSNSYSYASSGWRCDLQSPITVRWYNGSSVSIDFTMYSLAIEA